jgi:hypothetical protein
MGEREYGNEDQKFEKGRAKAAIAMTTQEWIVRSTTAAEHPPSPSHLHLRLWRTIGYGVAGYRTPKRGREWWIATSGRDVNLRGFAAIILPSRSEIAIHLASRLRFGVRW